ncbi:MAG: hypothetical protein NVSMB56_08480 [Pyrinomonadaceae bacterium]
MLLVLIAFDVAPHVSSATSFHILKTYQIGGEGGWDYLTLDEKSRRLYVTRGNRVMVLDADTGKVVGEIADTSGVHGVAVANEFGRGFISCGRSNTVMIFDLKTLKTIAQVKAGQNPDAIIYDPATKRVFAFNGRSHDATVIDASKGDVVGTIALGGKPEFPVSDEAGEVFVNVEDKNEIVAIDARKLVVQSHWSLAPGDEPTGLTMDLTTRRLFAVCHNKLMVVVNADTGKTVTTLPIGEGVDGVVFDPKTKLVFSSNGEGTLTVVHEDAADKFSVVETVTTQRSARTLAFDPKTHNVFLAAAKFGESPVPTPNNPRPRPVIVPSSFTILVVGQ